MELSPLDWLNITGSIASLIGLIVTFVTLYRVSSLSASLRQRSRDEQLAKLIEKIEGLPIAKSALTKSDARVVGDYLDTIRLYNVTGRSRRDRHLKSLIESLEVELQGPRQREIVLHRLRLIRVETAVW